MDYGEDKRIVLTLDAGGTNFFFSAIQGNKEIVEAVKKPSYGSDLKKCLSTIKDGFSAVKAKLNKEPHAISFAFPGPADYPRGIIDDLENLPGFKGGVALGPMLKKKFKLPVFINNDGNLFVLGEAIAGLLPEVNRILKEGRSNKQFKNLFGITLGTGFGGGVVNNGRMLIGDNSAAGEIWAMRNKVNGNDTAEEEISIRAVKRTYARESGFSIVDTLKPEDIYKIAKGEREGDQQAALEAFRRMGENIGDALANAITLIDGLIVIGGGISKAYELFIPQVIKEMNGKLGKVRRLEVKAFNLEDGLQLNDLIKGQRKKITIFGTNQTITYDPLKRIGIGLSRLGTERAVCIGAYVFALKKLDGQL